MLFRSHVHAPPVLGFPPSPPHTPAAARKHVMVDKGALRLAQKQFDGLKARANAGELSPGDAHDELEAHAKAVMLVYFSYFS